jgi:hypothetical protein
MEGISGITCDEIKIVWLLMSAMDNFFKKKKKIEKLSVWFSNFLFEYLTYIIQAKVIIYIYKVFVLLKKKIKLYFV